MNLKEAFRFQNKLQLLLNEALEFLDYDKNVVKIRSTYLRHKIMPEAEDEVTEDTSMSEYADRITEMAEFTIFLICEKEKLYDAIREAKRSADIDIDSETALNSTRQRAAKTLMKMAQIRNSEQLIPYGGYGFRFNAEGNQISYKCDVKKVTTINFDRKAIQCYVKQLTRTIDNVSADIDKCVVNTNVAYEPPFDVNSSFADVFDSFCSQSE